VTRDERRKLLFAPITVGILATVGDRSSGGMAGGCTGPSNDIAKLPVYNIHTGSAAGKQTATGPKS
jgi:hypothetical protein